MLLSQHLSHSHLGTYRIRDFSLRHIHSSTHSSISWVLITSKALATQSLLRSRTCTGVQYYQMFLVAVKAQGDLLENIRQIRPSDNFQEGQAWMLCIQKTIPYHPYHRTILGIFTSAPSITGTYDTRDYTLVMLWSKKKQMLILHASQGDLPKWGFCLCCSLLPSSVRWVKSVDGPQSQT